MVKKLLYFFPLLLILYACGPTCEELTRDDLMKEQDNVLNVIKTYNKAFQEKNFAGVVPTLSENVKFFGTDSNEIIISLSQYKKVCTDQFNSYDQMLYGDMVDVHIEMDKFGTFASIIYGLPATIYKGGKTQKLFFRVSRTLKKEQGNWHIITGIIGITNTAPLLQTQIDGQ